MDQFMTDLKQIMLPPAMRTNQYFHDHPTGQVFRIMRSSNGRINVSLNTGPRDFLGYVDTVDDARALIARRFGSWS